MEAARKAAALVRQLRDFGQDTEGAPVLLDVNQVLRDLSPLLRAKAGTVELKLRLMDGTPRVLIDPSHFEGIIISLAVNARDAMPEGGILTLTTDVDAARELVCLRATDTGVGMSDATVSRVFDPFFTTREVGQGSGLGLSVVYGLVSRSGGRIQAESTLGHGTTFTIEWPLAVV